MKRSVRCYNLVELEQNIGIKRSQDCLSEKTTITSFSKNLVSVTTKDFKNDLEISANFLTTMNQTMSSFKNSQEDYSDDSDSIDSSVEDKIRKRNVIKVARTINSKNAFMSATNFSFTIGSFSPLNLNKTSLYNTLNYKESVSNSKDF